jgi:hypothetical protein
MPGGMRVGRVLVGGYPDGSDVTIRVIDLERTKQPDRRRLITTSKKREPRPTGIALSLLGSTFECTSCEAGYDLPFGKQVKNDRR